MRTAPEKEKEYKEKSCDAVIRVAGREVLAVDMANL